MNNAEEITQILTIILTALGILLAALIFVYVTILFKNKKNEQDNAKNMISGNTEKREKSKAKPKKSTTTYTKQSIFDFMEFDKIEDNMIIQKNGMRYVMVMQCQGVNYDLLSQAEKNGVEQGFLQFLNTLRAPVQLYIQTRTVNLEKSIEGYTENVNEVERELNRLKVRYQNARNSGTASDEELKKQYYEIVKQNNLLEYGRDIIRNTQKMSKNKNVLNNKYYIVIYYYPDEINEKMDKSEIQDNAFNELYTRAQSIARTLFVCDVKAKVLTSDELAELLYVAYNRDESETFDFEKAMKAGFHELYSTAPDIWDKKIKQLDKEIEERAMNMADSAIEEVKSERQKQFEVKSNNIEELAKEMANIMLRDNSNYIGNDIASEAIAKLNSKMNELEEETKDEQKEQKSAHRGRPRKQTIRANN